MAERRVEVLRSLFDERQIVRKPGQNVRQPQRFPGVQAHPLRGLVRARLPCLDDHSRRESAVRIGVRRSTEGSRPDDPSELAQRDAVRIETSASP